MWGVRCREGEVWGVRSVGGRSVGNECREV